MADKCACPEVCEGGEQPDPFEGDLKWNGCPAKRAFERQDVRSALFLRGLASMSPLEGWPHRYTAGPVLTWMQIAADRQERDRLARESRQHG